jgi:hypothetical protein
MALLFAFVGDSMDFKVVLEGPGALCRARFECLQLFSPFWLVRYNASADSYRTSSQKL